MSALAEKTSALCFLLVFVCVSANNDANAAEEGIIHSNRLSLREVSMSIQNHYPLVISALRDLDRANADLASAQGGFDPQLKSYYSATPAGEYQNRNADVVIEQPTRLWGAKVLGGYRIGAGRFGPYDEKLATLDRGEVRGGIELPLLRGGPIDERRARLKVAELGMEGAQFALKSQELDAHRVGSHRYWEWVAAGRKLVINEELRKLAADRDAAMQQRVRVGDVAQVEQTDNVRALLQRDASLVAARRAFQKAQLELSIFMRDRMGEPLLVEISRVPTRIDSHAASIRTKIEALKKDAIPLVERHPEVERLRRQLSQVETEVSLSQNLVLPKLDSDFMASKDLGAGPESKRRTEYRFALRLEFPLLFRSPRGRLAAANASQNRAEAQLVLIRNRVKVAIEDSVQAIDAAARRIELAELEVVAARKVEEAEKTRFKHGDSNILTVNLREQATADARVREVDAMIDLWKSIADLQAAAGTRLNEID